MQNKVRSNSKVAQAPSTAIAAPLPLGGRLILTATIRQHSVGRGFEEVYKREGHKLKSVLHKRRSKTPLRGIEKGSTLFALPSEGSNPIFGGVFGGCGGLFSKSPPQKPAAFRRPVRRFPFPSHKTHEQCERSVAKARPLFCIFLPFCSFFFQNHLDFSKIRQYNENRVDTA